jgi:transposase-like zinc-binding protein
MAGAANGTLLSQAARESDVAAPPVSCYRRREPERTLLHATVRTHWKTFLAEVEEHGEMSASLPRFVVGEFERYLGCAILAHGFARVRCAACGDELLVAFSCKGRGFCPSCTSRRMHDTAAHLVDRVIPQVPVRQWVLSLPQWARFLLARDPGSSRARSTSRCGRSSPNSAGVPAAPERSRRARAQSPSFSASAAR